MKTMKHTKAPWKNFNKTIQSETTGEIICECCDEFDGDSDGLHPSTKKMLANAKLIAAAPRLYELIRRYVSKIESIHAEMKKKPTSFTYWTFREILNEIESD